MIARIADRDWAIGVVYQVCNDTQSTGIEVTEKLRALSELWQRRMTEYPQNWGQPIRRSMYVRGLPAATGQASMLD